MWRPRIVALVALVVLGMVVAPGTGCSSTTSAPGSPGGGDAGALGVPDASTTTTSDSSLSSDSGDDGTCAPASTSSYTAPTYVAAVGHQGVCTQGQIAAFVAACGDNGSMSSCNAWQTQNVASEAGAGDPCGNCILAPMNNGAVWSDPEGFINPNYAGCIQLLDATDGAACGAAFDDESGCESVACDACGSDSAFLACVDMADAGSCSSYVTSASAACLSDHADGGVLDECSPGAASNTQDPDFTLIANLICGSGITDGGSG